MRFRMLFVSLLFATTLAAQNFQGITVKESDASGGLANAIARLPRTAPVWAAWTVPASKGHSIWCDRCSLDGRHGTFSMSDGDDLPFVTQIVIVARIDEGKVRSVHFFNATCPIEGNGDTLYLLTKVGVEDSIAVLRASLGDTKEGQAIAAISLHEHPSVTPTLIDLARHDPRTQVRRDALFWLAQKAGEKAASELRRAVDEDPNEEVKEHAVFAISQLPPERSVPMLIELVKTHKSRAVRKRAMFWLAQTNDPRALDLVEQILSR